MAQTYTLEEAAEKLKVAPDEFKRRLRDDWSKLRTFRDGSTLRFRSADVDELARSLGLVDSDPDVPMSNSSVELTVPVHLDLDDSGPAPALEEPPPEIPEKKLDSTDEVENLIVLEDEPSLGTQEVFLLADEPVSVIPAPAAPEVSPASLSSTQLNAKSDSDVRLEKADQQNKKKPSESDSILTEDMIDLGVPQGGSSAKLAGSSKKKLSPSSSGSKPGSGKANPANLDKTIIPPEDDSSEFELSLDVDSSDEFELSLSNDSSGDISLGEITGPSAGPRSGINLGNPVDSGLSLEDSDVGPRSGGPRSGPRSGGAKSGPKNQKSAPKLENGSDEEIDFELSLDSAGASSTGLGSSKSAKKLAAQNLEDDSDSEFELTLDGDGGVSDSLEIETEAAGEEQKGDIFETDFEIPALDDDSASEAIALDESDTDLESSDFDLETGAEDTGLDDESASEVVAIDDETDVPETPKPKKKKKPVLEEEDVVVADDDAVSFDDMDLDQGLSASKALEGVAPDEDAEAEDDEADEKKVVFAGPAPWGVLPAIFLFPTVFVMFVAGLMGFEMMRSIWGYHQPTKPTSIVIEPVANMFDAAPKK